MARALPLDDPELLHIQTLSDPKIILSKRSYRKGAITKAENAFLLTEKIPPSKTDITQLERRLTDANRAVQLYQALTMQHQTATEEGKTLTDEEIRANVQTELAQEELLDRIDSHLQICRAFRRCDALEDTLDTYEAYSNLKESKASLEQTRTDISAFVSQIRALGHADLEVRAQQLRPRIQALETKAADQATSTAAVSTSTSSAATPAVAAKESRLPKIKPPTFSGKVLDWDGFWTLFQAYLSKYPTLEPSDKVVLLVNAMTQCYDFRQGQESSLRHCWAGL